MLDILGLPHIYSRFRHHARWTSLGAAMATSSSRISHSLRSLLLFGFIHFYFHQALERWWRDENNLRVAIHETHCGTTHLPHRDTLFFIIFLYFADFRSVFLQSLSVAHERRTPSSSETSFLDLVDFPVADCRCQN